MRDLKGITIFKRKRRQSYEEFKDIVCNEYNIFLEEFILKGGSYNDMYQAMLANAIQKGAKDEQKFRHRFNVFTKEKITRLLEIVKQASEVPAIDVDYFKDLYKKYQKSSIPIQQLTDEFILIINELHRLIDIAYFEMYQSKNLENILIFKKSEGQTQEEFKDMVCNEYNNFLEEFILKGGAYNDMYQAMLTNAMQKGQEEENKFRNQFRVFGSESIARIIEMSKNASEVPVINLATCIEKYIRFQQSNNSPIIIQQITDEFFLMFNELSCKIDESYKKYQDNLTKFK